MDLRELIRLAFEQHRCGRIAEAKATAQRVLSEHSSEPSIQNLLGLIAFSEGNLQSALNFFEGAISGDSGCGGYHSNRGMALAALSKSGEALESYERAVLLSPQDADLRLNLAISFIQFGRAAKAIPVLEELIARRPDHLAALCQLGIALHHLSDLDQATAAFYRVLALKPDHLEAHNWIGMILIGRNQLQEAVAALNRAVTLHPRSAELLTNLGCALQKLGRNAEAIVVNEQATAVRPDLPEAYCNLGSALVAADRIGDAVVALERAVALRPNYATAWSNLGNAYRESGQIERAIGCYERALIIDPTYKDADDNRVYTLYFHPNYTASAILRENLRWSERHVGNNHAKSIKPRSSRAGGQRLRIGYVSPHFRNHCQSLFTLPLFQHHDRQGFEIYCYSNVSVADALTSRIRESVDVWRDISILNDEEAANVIRQDEIDILVDLTLHMEGNRLLVFAKRAAPIQLTWLGYPGTTGLAEMDYRLTDPFLDIPGLGDENYVERSVRLPESFWCYDPASLDGDAPLEVGSPPAMSTGHITFGCLNSFAKVNNCVLEVWRDLLISIPGSRLRLLCPNGPHRKHVAEILLDRVDFVDRCPRPSYLREYSHIDVCLDTFPCNGHTTSMDALWMGVPVVTLVGGTAIGRGSLSILSNIGLSELATYSSCPFDQPHLRAGDLNRQHAARLEVSHGSNVEWTGRCLA